MGRTVDISEGCPVSEMAVVDTFTKLIFGEQSGFTDSEEQIIRALRAVDDNVALDSYFDIGIYLRACGVKEMIALASRVCTAATEGLALKPGHRPELANPTGIHRAPQ